MILLGNAGVVLLLWHIGVATKLLTQDLVGTEEVIID